MIVRFVIIEHMKPILPLTLLGLFLFAACQPATTQATPASPTLTSVPSVEPSLAPSLLPPTPSPTGTLVPAPRAFTEAFDVTSPYWSFKQMDNGQPASSPEVRSGFLVFNLSAPNQWVYSIYAPQEYTDARVDAQVDFVNGSDGAVGLVCRYSETDGWYEFNVFSDQTFTLLFGQWLAEGVARYRPMYRGFSNEIKSDANEIGLDCQNDTLTPFVNGVQLRKWEDTRYGLKSGTVGVSAASFENAPLVIGFDWVRVSEP